MGNGVEKAPMKMRMKPNSNARTKIANEQINVPNCNKVWFDQEAIEDTFAFCDLAQKHRVTCDNKKEDAFSVHVNGKTCKFTPTEQGLCHC